ncbi:MAG: serine/threonine-protein phosphatase [Clostridia bacterium]|nr:serine/threonine-protein phosphatase [Clostridia bacterium]
MNRRHWSSGAPAKDCQKIALMEGRCRAGDLMLTYAGASDPGRIRRCNEDSLLLLPEAGLFAVADGLGGLEAGDLASSLALKHIARLALDPATGRGHGRLLPLFSLERELRHLGTMIRDANTCLYDQRLAMEKNMATTLVLVRLWRGKALIGHVGDSRLYRWREGKLSRLTVDHSLAEELHRQGLLTADQANHSPQRHVVTRALGAERTVDPELHSCSLARGDLLLLCTDGLTNMLGDTVISDCLWPANDGCAPVVQRLIDQANAAGGRDNITVVVMAVG